MTETTNLCLAKDNSKAKRKDAVPIWEKYTLTIREAASYFNIGEKKLRQLMDEHDDLVLMVGSRKLIKRTKMERFLDNTSCI